MVKLNGPIICNDNDNIDDNNDNDDDVDDDDVDDDGDDDIDDDGDDIDDDDDGEDDDDDEYDVNCDFPSGHSSYLAVPPSSKPRPKTSNLIKHNHHQLHQNYYYHHYHCHHRHRLYYPAFRPQISHKLYRLPIQLLAIIICFERQPPQPPKHNC